MADGIARGYFLRPLAVLHRMEPGFRPSVSGRTKRLCSYQLRRGNARSRKTRLHIEEAEARSPGQEGRTTPSSRGNFRAKRQTRCVFLIRPGATNFAPSAPP